MKKQVITAALLTAISAPLFAGETDLDTIVVTASRNEIPLQRVGSSLTVITAKEIEQRGYSSLAEVLRTTPGIATSNSGGAGAVTSIRIRGEEGYRTKVLIDGVDVSDPSSTRQTPLMEHIAAQDIERIEILRGPQGMMYGADAGGVVNIITKRATESFSANASTESGSYNTRNSSGTISGKNNVADYVLSLARQSTDGFNSRTNDTSLDKDGYDNQTINGRFGVNLTDKLRAQLTARYVEASGEYDGCSDPVTFATRNSCDSDIRLNNQKIDLTYVDAILSHALSYAETRQTREYFTDNAQAYYYDSDIRQSQYVGTAKLNPTDTAIYGIDQKQDSIYNATYSKQAERDQTGLFAEWQSSLGEQFFYTAGARNDDSDDFGSHTSYRTTAAWLQPMGSDMLKYKTSYGTGFSAPTIYQIGYNAAPTGRIANLASLEPETSTGADLGIEFHGASGLQLEAVYFYQDTEDAIDYKSIGGLDGYIQSSGVSTSKGVELSAEVPVNTWITLLGNYTYNDTEDPAGNQRVRRPRHYGNAGARFNVENFSVLANMRFSNDSEDTNQAKLDDYQVFDVTATYYATRGLEVYARGQNIFDNEYEEVTGYNTAGSALYTGFRVTF